MIRLLTACFCALIFFAGTAEARQRHRVIMADPGCNVIFPCEGVAPSPRGLMIERAMGFGAAQKVYTPRVSRAAVRSNQARAHRQPWTVTASYSAPSPSLGYTVQRAVSQVIGGRPAGCPHAFCGCGASLHVFGKIIPSLNLAANWLRFPRAAPAPGMAAARHGHVFIIEAVLGNGTVLAHDSNSGRGLTRLHPRSLAGYTVVNPHGGAA